MKIQMIHISRLVDDLLDVARIRTGKFHLQNKHVDLYRVLSLAVDSILPMITEKRQNLLRDIPEGSAWVYGDSVRIEEALLNLLNNASKYTPEGGTIRVGLSLSPDEAVISIQDTGRGIEKEFQSAVFDPFFQAGESLKSRHAGLGLGLFLVREIVKLHQGKISLRSEGKDRGSSFEVRLPLAPSPELEEPVDTGEKIGGHGIRILLIEDQFLIAESMRLILEAFGCVVEYAGSGERGILAFYKGNFDAVVIDIGLPDMSGYEVVQKLRAMNSDRNGIFVALSGYGQAEDQKKAADAGFDAHFTKPADEEKLLSFIQSRLHDLESAH